MVSALVRCCCGQPLGSSSSSDPPPSSSGGDPPGSSNPGSSSSSSSSSSLSFSVGSFEGCGCNLWPLQFTLEIDDAIYINRFGLGVIPFGPSFTMVNQPGTSFWNSTEQIYDLEPMFGQIRGVFSNNVAEWETNALGQQSESGPFLGEDGTVSSQMTMRLDGGCRMNFQSCRFGIFLNFAAYRSCSLVGSSNALGADDCLQAIEFPFLAPTAFAPCRFQTVAWVNDPTIDPAVATPS